MYMSRTHRSDSDLNGPDPGASPHVENPSRLFVNGCKMVFVAHYYANHLMCDVEAIQFALRTALGGDIQWCNQGTYFVIGHRVSWDSWGKPCSPLVTAERTHRRL